MFPNEIPDLKYSHQDSLKIAAVSKVFNCIWFPLSFALPLGLSFLLLWWLNHRSVDTCQHIMMAGNVTRAFWRRIWKYFLCNWGTSCCTVQLLLKNFWTLIIVNSAKVTIFYQTWPSSFLTLSKLLMIYSSISKKVLNQIVVSMYLILNLTQCQLIQLSLYKSNCIILLFFQPFRLNYVTTRH